MQPFITASCTLDAFTQYWQITGYSRSNTDGGRLHVSVTKSGATLTVSLYRRAGELAGHLVAQGSGEVGLIECSAQNSSGLSGSVEVTALRASGGKLHVFYACDEDLHALEDGLASLTGEAGAFAGAPGFERFTAAATREVNRIVEGRFRQWLPRSVLAEPAPLLLTRPEQLTDAAALLALSLVLQRLAGAPDQRAKKRARKYRLRAEQALHVANVSFDNGVGSEVAFVLGTPAITRG
jgi:hypothetical protein